MTLKEKEQLEALEMYLLHAGQKAESNMLTAETLANSYFYKGRFGAFQEAYYLLHDFIEGRLLSGERYLLDLWGALTS